MVMLQIDPRQLAALGSANATLSVFEGTYTVWVGSGQPTTAIEQRWHAPGASTTFVVTATAPVSTCHLGA